MNWYRGLLRKPGGEATSPPVGSQPRKEETPPVVEPQAHDSPQTWLAAICHCADKSRALSWLQLQAPAWTGSESGDAMLEEVAQRGRFADVRLAAAQLLSGTPALERVARHSRNVDKNVYRHCADVLHARRQRERHAVRAGELATNLQALLAENPVSVSHLLELEHQLAGLEDAGPAYDQCRQLIEQANARVLEESAAQRDRQRAQAEAAREAERAGQAQREARELEAKEVEARKLEEAKAARELQLAREAQSTLAQTQPPPAQSTAPNGESSPDTRDNGASTSQRVKSSPVPAIDLDALRSVLDELEQAIEDGHLAQADAAGKKAKAIAGNANLPGRLGARAQRAHAQLNELRDWAKWGAGKKREELLAAAEELARGETGVDELAAAIPALRGQWNGLQGQGASSKEQWERFDAALAKAFEPVAALRAQEAERRAQARARREAMLAEWEAAVASVAWENADLAAWDARRVEMLVQWRGAPPMGPRDERILRKRLDTLVQSIQSQVDAVRNGEVERRKGLIASAEALRDESARDSERAPDMRRITSEIKALQERWRTGAANVRLRRGEEQKLWKRFRAVCDEIFSWRDTMRADEASKREQRGQTLKHLLDTFGAALAGATAQSVREAEANFRQAWDADRKANGVAGEALERRARELQAKVRDRLLALRKDSYRARLENLSAKATGELQAGGADSALLAQGRATREAILIDLEIALGLPSPGSAGEARRLRQLQRLQGRFRGSTPAAPDAEDLVARYHAAPALPDEGLESRFATIVNRLVEQAGGRK
jgi:hypothetical protein